MEFYTGVGLIVVSYLCIGLGTGLAVDSSGYADWVIDKAETIKPGILDRTPWAKSGFLLVVVTVWPLVITQLIKYVRGDLDWPT